MTTAIGLDEVGYGAWAGPVCVCATFFPKPIPDEILAEIKDSKKLSKRKRESIFNVVKDLVKYGIGYADPSEIDQMNVRQATNTAMMRALEMLEVDYKSKQYRILIDGNSNPGFSENIKTIIKGDDKIKQISCASIIAKVTRDFVMSILHQEFPVYHWETNVGYGTKDHIEALKRYGPSKYHRVSYKPFQQNL